MKVKLILIMCVFIGQDIFGQDDNKSSVKKAIEKSLNESDCMGTGLMQIDLMQIEKRRRLVGVLDGAKRSPKGEQP
jgi:hypothetical protein